MDVWAHRKLPPVDEVMAPSVRQGEFTPGPVYFFDQPKRQIKRARSNMLYFSAPQETSPPEETISDQEAEDKDGDEDELPDRLAGDLCEDGEPETSPGVGAAPDPTDAYRREAPRLLNQVAEILSQHEWTVGRGVPHGIVNILTYTWKDLTAGALEGKRGEQKKVDDSDFGVSASEKKETGKISSGVVGKSERKPQISSKPRVKKHKPKAKIAAPDSTTISFSISSNICKGPGWIVQPTCDESQQIRLCQWVVERLHTARNLEKLRAAVQNQNRPIILRYYGGSKAKPKDKRIKWKVQPSGLVFGIPQIPEVKEPDPAEQKLLYRINDGSTLIYYPSGCMAVCQSYSGLPCGGFYTNVFSDSEYPTVLATITAFGHGAVTHPHSSALTAAWDQDGGFRFDHSGNITKEWRWKADDSMRGKIVMQLSDLISVRLFSGTSGMLSFRCNNESVQLPLSVLSNVSPPKETPCLLTDEKFTSDAAQDLIQKSKPPAESKTNLIRTQGVLQMAREMERPEVPSAQWRRGGQAGRELKKLQRRIRTTLDDWLAYYRAAVGIKCPDTKRMPDAPLRTRLKREVQSAALPSLNPPEPTDAKSVQPEDGSSEMQELRRHLPSQAEGSPDSSTKLPRTPQKQGKEESNFTQIGPLRINGNIPLESVIILKRLESPSSTVRRCPGPPLFTPSTPLTVCPVLLRAALLGDGGRRRCCCSSTQMPVVTDLEYDAFVMGQPAHSQQIIVVCVTLLRQQFNPQAVPGSTGAALEQLYRTRNKHRTMPCAQCPTDSFRLVRYEISAVEHGPGAENVLLQQRHNAAPGMVLMYIRGKLLFVGYIFSDHSCSVIDLQKQICRSRADYRLGLSLPADYKYSDTVNMTANTHAHKIQGATLAGNDMRLAASVQQEMANDRTISEATKALRIRQRTFCIRPKRTPAFPRVPVISH
ncbi:hypothetical protein Q5P01_012672 [Channa striata]|uniref:FAM194 C-terminal domain-containing protein n=1 Tax=Channa striata TaxID=64152 RepID=A0AA88MPZ4_CHASR|nr:hypothetical protein Q5P01_012672 [Channa striata]